MPITITQPLGRCPTFAEFQALAEQNHVQISGNELAGDFCHPGPEQPTVTGHYAVEPNGDLRGDFTSHVMGKLAGSFSLTAGRAGIIITERPCFLPETVLKSILAAALKDFCAKFEIAE